MEDSRRATIVSALALWDSFPVDARPRPIVLAGTVVISSAGFDSSEAKRAFLAGLVETDVELPPGVLERLTAEAGSTHEDGLTPLRVVRATRTRRRFMTDRGMRQLPAWGLELTHCRGVWTVLSPTAETWWPASWDSTSVRETQHSPSTIDPTGLRLQYSFLGLARGSSRVAEVLQTDQALHVTIESSSNDDPSRAVGPGAALSGIEVLLDRPLGNRVLVDHLGNPMPVISAGNLP